MIMQGVAAHDSYAMIGMYMEKVKTAITVMTITVMTVFFLLDDAIVIFLTRLYGMRMS